MIGFWSNTGKHGEALQAAHDLLAGIENGHTSGSAANSNCLGISATWVMPRVNSNKSCAELYGSVA